MAGNHKVEEQMGQAEEGRSQNNLHERSTCSVRPVHQKIEKTIPITAKESLSGKTTYLADSLLGFDQQTITRCTKKGQMIKSTILHEFQEDVMQFYFH